MRSLLIIGILSALFSNSMNVFGSEKVMSSIEESQSSRISSFDVLRIKDQMTKFNTMINTANLEMANELVADDAPFYTPAFSEPAYGGSGYLSLVFWLRESFPDIQWKMEELIVEKNKAAVSWIASGTHKGDFMGIPATGKTFSARVMNIYSFNESYKITSDIAAEGMIAILQAIGAKFH